MKSVSERDAAEDVGYKEFKESDTEESHVGDSSEASEPKGRQFTWKDMEKSVKRLCHLLLQVSYVPAIVCMMVSIMVFRDAACI